MQLGDAPVIAIEKREEVFGQVALVVGRQRADDAEIHRQITRLLRVFSIDEDVPGMHVGVKEIVAEYLLEEDLDTAFGEDLEVHTLRTQGVEFADGDAVNALHHQHVGPGVIPEHQRVINEFRPEPIAPQQRAVGAFAHQIEFVENHGFVFAHDVARP